jgi:hypothetical protein
MNTQIPSDYVDDSKFYAFFNATACHGPRSPHSRGFQFTPQRRTTVERVIT